MTLSFSAMRDAWRILRPGGRCERCELREVASAIVDNAGGEVGCVLFGVPEVVSGNEIGK